MYIIFWLHKIKPSRFANHIQIQITIRFISLGTGKTATFAVGILQRLDTELKQCQALVLAPTRELALQIQKVIGALGDFMNIKIHACVGGTAVRDDIRTLQDGVHVVVGTPGRVYDMIQRRALRLDAVQVRTTQNTIYNNHDTANRSPKYIKYITSISNF